MAAPEPGAADWRARVLEVIGASGGCGATTLAATVSVRAAARGLRVVAVDDDPSGGGLEIVLAAEHLPGLRWADLAAVEGDLDGADLVRCLPTVAGVAALGHGLNHLELAGPAVRAAVVDALSKAADVLVVDAARWRVADPLVDADLTVVLSASGVTELAALGTTVRAVGRRVADTRLLLRGRRSAGLQRQIAAQLECPVLGCLDDEAQIRRDLRQGVPPRLRETRLGAVAEDLLDALRAQGARSGAGAS